MSQPPDISQPRYFWRRVLALLVDWALVALVTTLLVLPFLDPDRTGLRLSGAPLTFTTCQNVTSVSQNIADLVAPEVIAGGTLCKVRPFGFYNGRTLNLVYAHNQSKDGGVTWSTSRTLSVALNGDDEVVQVFTPQSLLVPLFLMILSAVLLGRNRRTPGKRLAGLRVAGQGCAMCREARRLGPFVVLGALTFAMGALPASTLSGLAHAPVWVLILGGGAIFAYFAGFFLLPLIRWRGAMPYDRKTGFEVQRS